MIYLRGFLADETDNYIASVTNLHVHSAKDIVPYTCLLQTVEQLLRIEKEGLTF